VIAIIDYGMGNLKSVANMLRKTGHDSQITSDPLVVEQAEKIILPGVGAFDAGMEQLNHSGLLDALNMRVFKDKTPVLGICLGAQLLANSSEEGVRTGLGWIDASVVKFDFSESDKPLKIPHMGWNYVNVDKKHPLFEGVPEPMRFYFVHSYHYICNDKFNILATSHYGYSFTCAVVKNNIMGVQFHPEKSHKHGMQLLRNFAERC
jgi:imidazole glycerol-phosphate synthase subunit HisH